MCERHVRGRRGGVPARAGADRTYSNVLAAGHHRTWFWRVARGAAGGNAAQVVRKICSLDDPFFQKFNNAMIRAARNNHFLRVHGANQREAEMLIEMSRNNLVAAKNYTLLFGLELQYTGSSRGFCRGRSILAECPFRVSSGRRTCPAGLSAVVDRQRRRRDRDGGRLRGAAELAVFKSPARAYAGDLVPEEKKMSPPSPATDVPQRFLPLDVKSLRFGRTAALTLP